MHIKKPTLDDLLREVYARLLGSIDSAGGRGLTWSRGEGVEEVGVLLELTNPRARLSATETRGRIFSPLGELCWYLSGSDQLEHITYYLPVYKNESEDKKTVRGAYGPRFRGNGAGGGHGVNQLEKVIERLKGKATTKRAVIVLLEPRDFEQDYKEIPCTVSLQFLIRNERLHMITSMRSNDAYFGLPHDIFCFTMIQELIARSIGVKLGGYKHFVGSLHLYNDKKADAERYLAEGWQSTAHSMPSMPMGCQMSGVADFLGIEQKIRSGELTQPEDIKLNTYWKDLAVLLMAYAWSKDRIKKNKLDELSSHINANAYKQYLRIKIKNNNNLIKEKSKQLSLL
ncbi:hypothetical protein JCM17844_02690 [Iodidimonas gelatinilytica]|uniref:Thymidylate synthase/dCMP hydroxymethylase domain-containing protein n=1 Tax=Iodidimonas gelatinilytica TaxID=1236966 RepID=A0A5A7MYH2_9PROT|nr:thymidylate synthase [Iodidimonas gelatinilytica]GEQ96632.1 hypothetical protein JCM17844_02690 [Iodidimonas gelatinilytica]GER00049.1 hypothetical protein JCM17845_06720 [Iodidimonas gelatinilytica]